MANPSRHDCFRRTLRAMTLGLCLPCGVLPIASTQALAQDAPADSPAELPPIAESSQYAQNLESAKGLYFSGDIDKSLLAFRALQLQIAQAPDTMPWEEAVETLTYLGEILVKTGDDDGARRAFRAVLEEDIETRISPYNHPVEVVFVFNRVREQVEAERLAEIPEVIPMPRAPVTTYLPLGIPQFARGRVGAGLAFGGGQVVMGAVSLGLFNNLKLVNRGDEGHPKEWTVDQIAARTQTRRYTLQWPASTAFYALWLSSTLEARVHWKRSHRDTALIIMPGAGGQPGLTIAGRTR